MNREHNVSLPALVLSAGLLSGSLTFLLCYALDAIDWPMIITLGLIGGSGVLFAIGSETIYHYWAQRRLERHQAATERLVLAARRSAMVAYLQGQAAGVEVPPQARSIRVNGVPKPFLPLSLSPHDREWRMALRSFLLYGAAAGGYTIARMTGAGRLFKHSGHWGKVAEVGSKNELLLRPGQGQPVSLGPKWTLERAIGYLDNGLPLDLPAAAPPEYDPLALGRVSKQKGSSAPPLSDPYPEGPPEEEQT